MGSTVKDWPDWWEWELEFTSHLEKRMEDRDFTELDLRAMLERAESYRSSVVEERWMVSTRHRGAEWAVIVEPDSNAQLLIVVPAYPVKGSCMKDRYLEVTFRKGKPLAAYLYLPRSVGAKSTRTEEALPGVLVDFSASGEPIGLEIITLTSVTVSQINVVLSKLGLAAISPEELAPLQAA